MKKILFSVILLAIFSCNSKTKSKKIPSDTSTIFIGYHNFYQGGSGFDTAIRIIRDSAHIDGDAVEHLPDTTYFVRLAIPIIDPKDSTHTRHLKAVNGNDTFTVKFLAMEPRHVFVTYPPSTPYHIYPPQPQPVDTVHKPINRKVVK